MSEKLKRCPFCGSTDIRECFGIRESFRIFPELFCGECAATIYEYDTHEDLIKLWNTRPIEDELNKRIAELEEQLRWKPLSELPDENREVLVKTDRNIIIIIFSHDIEEFNYEEKEHFGYGLIEHFMELPGGEG